MFRFTGADVSTTITSRAALIVFASFMLTFTGCGLNFAFGIYQELYESMGGPFENASPAQIDLIGTLAVSVMTIGAPFASAWARSYKPRTVTLWGAALFALGNVLASFGQKLWHFVVAQGLIMGCGTCLSYIPAVTIAPAWYDRRRGLAMGIILSGTGVGGVVWAPVLRALNAAIGFRETLRLTGALAFLIISLSSLVLRWDPESQRQLQIAGRVNRGPLHVSLVNWNIVRSRKFAAQAAGAILQASAYYVPVYYFSTFSKTLGYSAAAGANFIALSNGASACGKVVLGHVADRYGRLNILLLCTFLSTLATLGLWLPSSVAQEQKVGRVLFITFTMLYGVMAGAYVSLFPTALVELFGVQNFTSVNGFLYMLRGIGTLVATPLAGLLIRQGSRDKTSSPISFEKTSIMVGALLAGSSLAVLWVRVEAGLSRGTWVI